MQGIAPHMLRNMPGYGMDMMGGMDKITMDMMRQQQLGGMPMNMMGMGPIGGMPMNMNMNMMGMDQEMMMNDPNAKRDYYGERLYSKISSNPNYANISDFFSKIVGIFLDLEEQVIERLIKDDTYFDIQVRETVRLLAERSTN
ncbi:MAG: hypothetical protein ACK5YA_01180 [bacterium]